MSAPWWDSDEDRSRVEYRAYVGNLPWGTDERSLKDAFADYFLVDIVTDRETGRSRGFGFVWFDNEDSLSNAIQDMNGQELGGRTITVDRANQRPRRWRR
ncbi:glycine-rich RNA-binding protein GRP2A-like [Hordeum vulgare subsp. vulgare]|uniref:glycine-rich RNA-binding protein GRP2A-like n=1 Tax=Hordeum vulgare subsp. vulgare TaxID=112509 RepID=UPI001D1A5606|nr:glycine-rich RNA-binding protein GRP2A-like [Hordeum vulgare subsp. vulgare]